MPPDRPFISCVIPTINRRSVTETVAAIERQTFSADELIVVVDDEQRGPAATRNDGIRQSSGDFIAFVDDDAVPPEDWLATLVSVQREFDADVVGGTYEESDPLLNEIRQRRRIPRRAKLDDEGLVGNTGNILYRRTSLLNARNSRGQIFDERFGLYGSEDMELMMRLRASGARVAFAARPVLHLKRLGPGQFLRHQFNRGIGVALLERAYRNHGSGVFFQRGELWDSNRPWIVRAARSVAKRLIGPFDFQSFESLGNFALFWLGSKTFVLGYLRGRFMRAA